MRATACALLRHEVRLHMSLWLWVARRRHGTDGGQAFGYARGQGATMFAFAFVCVVETLAMFVLLRDWPIVHWVVLVLDVYTIEFVIGLHAASVVRPHVLNSRSLRVRYAAHVDLDIPLEEIATVRRELRTTHRRAEGELDLAIGSQTTVTLKLTEPVAHFTFLGRRRDIRLVRFHADDADTLVRSLRAVMRERTAPPPPPVRPA
ncbi:hypothetical protein GCM10023084_01690 [Streptomyces lacrimifluminis]|uniref:Uncharacterized protein n=1 Tax=Streptomyces lacrimifluminis TaxID=1500077 RepID=A0A917KMH8_9ACTN|nr:hypothetical protein [Streptomyces lacrimifluminis]GGJ21016.1 hypothetical protein GCM10012282_16770 [Streptomyces lacrimifluminis]